MLPASVELLDDDELIVESLDGLLELLSDEQLLDDVFPATVELLDVSDAVLHDELLAEEQLLEISVIPDRFFQVAAPTADPLQTNILSVVESTHNAPARNGLPMPAVST